MSEHDPLNWNEEIGKMRMRLANMESAMQKIVELTEIKGCFDLDYLEVCQIAKKALDD